MKLGICVPARENVNTKFAYCLAQLVSNLELSHEIFFEQGSILPQQRINLVEQAINRDCTHILFLDSDMIFPANIATELLKHDVDMVACNYVTRTKPYRSTAFLETENFEKTLKKSEGLVEVASVGLGIALIRASVFENIPNPAFKFEWSSQYNSHMGEDIYFCELLKNSGYSIYVDASLSNRCAHIGETACKMDVL